MTEKQTRFNPFGRLAHLHPLHKLGKFIRHIPASLRDQDGEVKSIRLDVAESGRSYTIKAEMPGIDKDDIKVSIDGNQVSIRAEGARDEPHRGAAMLCHERFQGRQYRNLSLAQEVDDAKAVATYQDGILELVLPKKNGGHGRQLAIQ